MARTLVITGSASGIGKATAALAEERGCKVIRVDLKEGDVKVDLATPAGRRALVEGVNELSGGKIDALIACAGVAVYTPLTLQVNYFGAIATLEGLRPFLAKGDTPRAVGVTSFASIMPSDPELVETLLKGDEAAALEMAPSKDPSVYYSSSKAAFARWMRRHSTSQEWVGAGILLNGVGPGMVVTPMTEAYVKDPVVRRSLDPAMPMPIGRDARPEEIGELLYWLSSPANSMMVGQIIFIDGGADATIRGDSTW
ncbi:MAG TPA: SDR family oxidoreductase [Chloroflexia bacterium]|nr:SDR family oxidoreductase [Chloroflexia bacterium]